MSLPPVSLGRTTNVGSAALNPSAPAAAGPAQRKNILARMATASRSTLERSRNFTGGLFKARPGDASSIPRSAPAANTHPAATASSSAQTPAPAQPGGPATTAPTAAQPHAMALTPRLSMALHNQKLVVGAPGQTNRTERLLESILSKHDQRYQGLAELNQNAEKTEYLMVDTQHRLLHAHASDAAISLFKSSENRPNRASHVAMPTDAHRAQITGVHTDTGNTAWRIHENKLYALQGGQWQENTQGATLKTLHNIGGGHLFGLNDTGKVYSLNDLNTPLPFEHKVTALGRSQNGELMALSEDTSGQHLLAQRNALGPDVHDVHHLIAPTGTDNDEAMKPTSVAIAGQRLLATTASGKLLQATMPTVAERQQTRFVAGELVLEEAPPSKALQAAFGNHTLSDFFHDEANVLHARVKDKQGLEHSAAWDHQRQDFVPGWSMAPLVMDRQRGLPVLTPDAAAQIQLPRGKIASHDNTLLVQDPRT
ncbi:AvrE-family type 3 secretion system effector, partial [Pseudomonas sp.]|uniref:AvrE-family type 3 secretion system effector n=1 Tax=Pseudomonas sp. TaxID=306 RepID=UPI002ED7FD0C